PPEKARDARRQAGSCAHPERAGSAGRTAHTGRHARPPARIHILLQIHRARGRRHDAATSTNAPASTKSDAGVQGILTTLLPSGDSRPPATSLTAAFACDDRLSPSRPSSAHRNAPGGTTTHATRNTSLP